MNVAAPRASIAAAGAPRRARRPSLSNEAFLDKALDIFLEQGFERTSIEAITASVGMAKRTVYLRYGDKTSLFQAALKRAIEDWIVPVERLEVAECEDLEETLLAIGQILVDNALNPAGLRLLRLMNTVAAYMPEVGDVAIHQGSDSILDYLAGLFRRHLERQGLASDMAEDAAEAFLHLVVGGPAATVGWGMVRDKAAIDARTRYSVRLFLYGLAPAPARPPPKDQDPRLLAEAMAALDDARSKLARAHAATSDNT